MPTEIYEIVAQGARYWFLFLMVLIVWRSYRWYRKDQKQRKKRLRLLPDAGYIGELVVIHGGEALEAGTAIPVPREGTLGFKRMNDVCLPVQGVAGRHLWFCFDRENGLRLEPCFGKHIKVDDEERTGRRHPLYMIHGSRLYVGQVEVRLRLFAGFETRAHAAALWRQEQQEDGQEPQTQQQPVMTQEQFLLWQQQMMAQQARQMMHQQYLQQLAYQQWMQAGGQAMPTQTAADGQGGADGYARPEQADVYENAEEGYFVEEADEAPYEDAAEFVPAVYYNQIEFETDERFYPPDGDLEDGPWAYAQPSEEDSAAAPFYPVYDEPEDEDLTDAAAPPKSAYVGDDEAEQAKKAFWDKYLGGGGAGE